MVKFKKCWTFPMSTVTGNAESSSDTDDDDEFQPKHFPTVPCLFTLVNDDGYFDDIQSAIDRVRSDSLQFETLIQEVDPARSLGKTNEVTSTIQKIERMMKICKHTLHRSTIYTKPEGATTTYVKMMDVNSYLNKILTNAAINDALVKHFQTIERIISHLACEVIHQIEFNLDLIEVSNGFFFQISRRTFIANAIPEAMIGKVSPRAFVPYDCSTPPIPRYFEQGILNSFPDVNVRINFLNKFYQCLCGSNMPHKIKRLVLAGPRDSGKTVWGNVLRRIIPDDHIASVTNEGQFSGAMIKESTQLVMIDEWSRSRM